MFSFLNFIFFVAKYTLRKYSFLRILQILEAKKHQVNGLILDVGGNDYSHNISNYFDGDFKIQFADKFPKNDDVIKLDLEKDTTINQTYNFVCLMNVLEHIKNYRNVIQLCKNSLSENGKLIGSVPFIFKIHYSPKDYFRYSEQLLYEELKSSGFNNIIIKPLGLGLFTNFYSSFCDYTNRIPLLNVFIVIIFILLDKIFFFLSNKYIKSYPIGYFFIADN